MKILKDLDKHAFYPDTSRNEWLLTDKKSYTPGRCQFPGLFRSDNYILHLNMVLVALAIEIAGILFLTLPQFSGLGLFGAIAGGTGFLMDFGIAFILVNGNRNICYFENMKILFMFPENEPGLALISNKLSKIKRQRRIGYILIFLVAVVKFYFLWEGYGVLELLVIIMGFLFLIAALIHIFFTDLFFGFWFRFIRKVKRDRENAVIEHAPLESREFYTDVRLTEENFNDCPFIINPTNEMGDVKLSTGVIERQYKSVILAPTNTLLTDKDVEKLCSRQGDINQSFALSLVLLGMQLRLVTPAKKYQNFNTQLLSVLPNVMQTNNTRKL